MEKKKKTYEAYLVTYTLVLDNRRWRRRRRRRRRTTTTTREAEEEEGRGGEEEEEKEKKKKTNKSKLWLVFGFSQKVRFPSGKTHAVPFIWLRIQTEWLKQSWCAHLIK